MKCDPTSWIFQANVHAAMVTPTNPLWDQCQHGNFFFFSWHRMYLYYFDRIVRAASGDPNLTLPYWNYTDDPNVSDVTRRTLPGPFQKPAVECAVTPPNTPGCNPLFVNERAPGINDGSSILPPGAVDYSVAFACTNFDVTSGNCKNPNGFGSAAVSVPTHFTGKDGALEITPHNVVHGQIGGWMANPLLAARDPTFFLHHANIDRLWKRWLDQGVGGRTQWVTRCG
jgi:tyrosinase